MADDTVCLFFPSSSSKTSRSKRVAEEEEVRRPVSSSSSPPQRQAAKRAKSSSTPPPAAAPAAPAPSSSPHECFARTLREFLADQARHPREPAKLAELLLTKHQSYLQVIFHAQQPEQPSSPPLLRQERDLWILLDLLREPRQPPTTAPASAVKLNKFDLTDADRLEWEFSRSPRAQLVHRVCRWTHLVPKQQPLLVQEEEPEEEPLREVWRLMRSGALYYLPRQELESKRATAQLPQLPKWRRDSLRGGEPFQVTSPSNVRTGNCYRARWKLACRDLAASEDASLVERRIYGVLGGGSTPAADGVDVEERLWLAVRQEMEAWADGVLRRHHEECGELVRGRSRGERTTREDALLSAAAAAAALRPVHELFDCVLLLARAQEDTRVLQLARAVLAGELERFLLASCAECDDDSMLRVWVHVALYFGVQQQGKNKSLLPRTGMITPGTRNALISRYLDASFAHKWLGAEDMLPYVACLQGGDEAEDARRRFYARSFSATPVSASYLRALLPIANSFNEAELVVELLLDYAIQEDNNENGGLEWLAVLCELQPDAQPVTDALLYACNHLLARSCSDDEARARRILLLAANASSASSPYLAEFTMWRSAHELLYDLCGNAGVQAEVAAARQSRERIVGVLQRARDVERRRALQQRELECERDVEPKLIQAVSRMMQALHASLLQQQLRLQDEVACRRRDAVVGEALVTCFTLAKQAAQEVDLAWATVHQTSPNRQTLWGQCVIGMTRSVSLECSRRMQQTGEDEGFRQQIKTVLGVIQHAHQELLGECERPLSQFLL